ncbi:MAG TPA: hypothetical protein VHP83_05280, partial [Aggregatilineaceae bacterium]|nr:hypothetical protein [Aggregatilineaceae bacterium]
AERLIALGPMRIFQDAGYQALVANLDSTILHQTADHAREAYEQGLPAIKEKYQWSNTVMGGYTLCNWVLGFLKYPQRLPDLIERHGRLVKSDMRSALPEIVALLADLPEGCAEWQQALVLFSLPLILDA